MKSESSPAETPLIPPELVGPPPRRVELTGSGLALAVLTAVILGIAVIFTCFIAAETVRELQIQTALRSGGNETVAKIDKLHQPYPVKEYVDYTFIGDGKTYTGKAIVPLETYHIVKSATSLTIRYLPENPTVNHPVDWEWSAMSEWDPILTVSLVAGLGFLFFVLPQMLFERKLVAQGIATIGIVTKCLVSGRSGEFINLKYDFRTRDGISVQGSGDFKTRQEIGAKILVLNLPQNPKQNILYPRSAWRIAKR
jgi:hypothetical protein